MAKKQIIFAASLAGWLVMGAGCASVPQQSTQSTHPSAVTQTHMQISSPAFGPNQDIPAKYTCDGDNSNPPLDFVDAPTDTVSLTLIMEDPDVPTSSRADGMWDHWVIFNIPPQVTHIAESQNPPGILGVNTRGDTAYGGPCPPDRQHRYFFKLFALDKKLDLPVGSTKAEVISAMEGHIIDQAELIGLYERQR